MKEVMYGEFAKHINRYNGNLNIIRDDNYTKLCKEYYYNDNKLVGITNTYFFINQATEHEFYITEEEV